MNLRLASIEGGKNAGRSELKHRSLRMALIIAIVFAMTGWIYALGWVAFKLFKFV